MSELKVGERWPPGVTITGVNDTEDWEPEIETAHPGMSLRDWFAGQALSGLLAGNKYLEGIHSEVVARNAYRFADGMLDERERR